MICYSASEANDATRDFIRGRADVVCVRVGVWISPGAIPGGRRGVSIFRPDRIFGECAAGFGSLHRTLHGDPGLLRDRRGVVFTGDGRHGAEVNVRRGFNATLSDVGLCLARVFYDFASALFTASRSSAN
jgi:hypothetical protein